MVRRSALAGNPAAGIVICDNALLPVPEPDVKASGRTDQDNCCRIMTQSRAGRGR
jgi:hypothetical protein